MLSQGAPTASLDSVSAGTDKDPMRILVLGGTAEASALIGALAGMPEHEVTLSLAGRTSSPRLAPVAMRVGGFGGSDGLAGWLRETRTDLLVDATHPFAATISANAFRAAAATGVPLLALRRPAWRRHACDRWTDVATIAEAAAAMAGFGEAPLSVLVTIGRQELAAFLGAAPRRHAYLVRAIEPIAGAVPPGIDAIEIRDRGPFSLAAEEALMRERAVGVLVTKNAGGGATAPKIEAARGLGLPVVIVRQPSKPDVSATVATSEQALAWIAVHQASPSTKRGV